MKTLMLLLVVLLTTGVTAEAARKRQRPSSNPSRVAVGARYHQGHTAIKRWPFEDGNMSYGLSYALFDGLGYLEAGLDYAPEGIEGSVVDDVWIPRLNLAILDGIFVAGIGIANGYVRRSEGGGQWTGLLYQFHLGLEIPLGYNLELGGGAYYSFEDWLELGDFEVGDLEYGVRLGYRF